jgi:hypothetical protein
LNPFKFFHLLFFLILSFKALSKEAPATIYPISFRDVTITIDAPKHYSNKETIIILYALPNGKMVTVRKDGCLEEDFDLSNTRDNYLTLDLNK